MTPVHLARRWAVTWLSAQDASALTDLVSDDYELRIGSLTLRGRQAYADAMVGQFQQFPGLGITVHEVIATDDRVALRFTEHGASTAHDGRVAAWGGIALHRCRAGAIVSTIAEEDYAARRRQLGAGFPDLVERPHPAPWDVRVVAPEAWAEQRVRDWLTSGADPDETDGVLADDQTVGESGPRLIEPTALRVDDLFTSGTTVAFHVTQKGPRLSDGVEVELGVAGLVSVGAGGAMTGHLVSDRLGASRARG